MDGDKLLAGSWALLAALLLAGPAWAGYGGAGPSDEEAAWIQKHVGMYVWGPCREKELTCYERDALADMVARLGARIVRSALTMYPETWRQGYDPTVRTFLDSLRRPDWSALLGRYDTVVLTLADGSGRQFEPEWTRQHYQRLTEYLLQKYADAEKTFILGLWECDHWLTEKDMADNPANVENYLQFFAARHAGIAAGRAVVPLSQSRVWEMIELVALDYTGQKGLINRVIPQTQADLYSLSSWGYQEELGKALDFIKSKAPDSPAFGRRNCMLGEAGGPRNWAPPAERIEGIRRILAQARRWGVPYVTWWQLVGSLAGEDCSLRTPAYEGGTKLAPYYWFYRAYHCRDDPLILEDFEVDPYGPPGGDYSEEGHSLNRIGGRRDLQGSAFAAMVPGGAAGNRSLYLSFGGRGGTWSTGLLQLEARRFSELRLAVRGDARTKVGLTDGLGRTAWVLLQRKTGRQARAWRRESVPLAKFSRIDLGRLERLSVTAEPGDSLWIDGLALASPGRYSAEPDPPAWPLPRAAHLLLKSSSQPLPLPGEPSRRLTWLRLVPGGGQCLRQPTLTDGTTTVRLARELVPGQVLEVLAGGTAYLRFGPLGPLLDVRRYKELGLVANDLNGQPQYHSFQPAGDGTRSWLEWHWESDFPVRHFRIALYGFFRPEWQARAAILVSSDGRNWVETTVGQRNWDEGFWIGRTPPDFPPSRRLWVRFQLFPDQARQDWSWTIGLSDFKIELWMDSEDCYLPRLEGLRYRDDGPADGDRGLLDVDW